MMALALGAGLTVISAATQPGSPGSWSCAYLAERLPRSLALRGDDAVSGEETRAASSRLRLSESALTRASSLALARALGASRLVVVRCEEEGIQTILEARAFDAERPQAGELLRVTRPRTELASAIDEIANRLVPPASGALLPGFAGPSLRALSLAGPALRSGSAIERARGLVEAVAVDPDSIDLRLSAVEALIAARDFDAAIRLASAPPVPDPPPLLERALRFQAGAALLEAGRYAEAGETFETLRRARESAAVLNNLGVARFRLRDPFASALFGRAGSLPDHRQLDISFNRALALLFEDRADLALPALTLSIEADPADVRTRLLQVWAFRLLGREAERAAAWERLVSLAPSFSSLGNPDLARRLERIFFSERTAESSPAAW